MSTNVRQHPLMRAAAALGDLGAPFYAEERQREVWNEASAVGLQFFLWAGYVLATAMVWFGGRGLLGWALGLLAVTGAGAWVTVLYAKALGVSGLEDARMARPRMALYGLLMALLFGGLVFQLR